jgi:hypothetical protein
MKSPLVYAVVPADSGYPTVFNQNAIFFNRNRRKTMKYLLGQHFSSVLFRYFKISQTFSYMSLYHFVTFQRNNWLEANQYESSQKRLITSVDTAYAYVKHGYATALYFILSSICRYFPILVYILSYSPSKML